MPLKIMAVDDDSGVLKLIKAFVEPLGCEVLTMADSREAAKRVESQKFDGILVDAHMPHLDGFDLSKRIRGSRSNSGVPIVMLTGTDDVETMREAFKAGISFFLGKPINRDRLSKLFTAIRGAMLTEKRRYARLPFCTLVSCRLGNKIFKSESVNISEGGMLLKSPSDVEVDQDLDLEFVMPQVSRPLQTRAKVVRKDPPDRIGVKFISLMPQELETIQTFVLGIIKG